MAMRVRFWGVRGSIAKPGPSTVRYGGNTSCVEVISDSGTRLVIDCGTGAHGLGQELMAEPQPLTGHILISHTHWDHIQGIPFFAPLFARGGRWDFYAPQGFGESIRETLAGQMEYTYFPVTPEAFGAEVHYHDLAEGSFALGDVLVRTRFLNHPALTLAYRIEADGGSLVYACDHEPHSRAAAVGEELPAGQDALHAEFLAGADLVIHDAQYTVAEYDSKLGWGHGTPDYAIAVCAAAGVKRLAITHHDPLRDDLALDRLVEEVRARAPPHAPELFAAAEGVEIELRGAATPGAVDAIESPAAAEDEAAPLLLIATAGVEVAKTIGMALQGEAVAVAAARSGDEALRLYRHRHPSLVIADDEVPGGSTALAAGIRDSGGDKVPILIMGKGAVPEALAEDAMTEWLQRPFSHEYARARIHTWLRRRKFRWAQPELPVNEADRLAALRSLGLLDSAPEQRFDRFTRLATALFDVPIALVSLVDAERQWFKSCVGFDAAQSSRDSSFCAHAILAREVMVVPDALSDDRFADNPLVTGEPRIRFYAGAPLFVDEDLCLGTLCLIDLRPRAFSDDKVRLLADLGTLVEQELAKSKLLH
jgi:phosphoribosyl 1,2-cyclic phosphodiesterase/CheY-like chemotaxis protein